VNSNLPFRQDAIDLIYTEYFPHKLEGSKSSVKMDKSDRTQQDKNLCTMIVNSKQGEQFQRLFSGDISGYPSQSEADLALCNILAFWARKDSKQIDRIFRESDLFRHKWDEKHGEQSYGAITIGKAITGTKEVYQEQYNNPVDDLRSIGHSEIELDPTELLRGYEVSNEYVNKLGQEQFLYDNLIIEQHVITIISMSGSGKTTFFYFIVAPALAKKGFTVWYIDADSPASDHKNMKAIANKHGFNFLNPDVNKGTSTESLVAILEKISNAHKDMSGNVLIFDTLKKFADLMSKGSVKKFYKLARKLANLGATVVLLGHANKYHNKAGNLVFEGVGDVRSDSDELIMLESTKNRTNGIDVTTIVDPDKGAKLRGLFMPFSFNISTSREVTFYDNPLEQTDRTISATPKATDDEILDATEKYLNTRKEAVSQRQLADHVADMTSTGLKRVKRVIVQNSVPKCSPQEEGKRFVYSIGDRNAHLYELPAKDSEQLSIPVEHPQRG